MKIKKVAVLANVEKETIKNAASKMLSSLKDKGIEADLVKLSLTSEDSKIKIKKYDLVVSLGGDGTVLTCAEIVNKKDIPILAVNMGTFGYITETSIDEFETVLDEFINDKTTAVARMRIAAKVYRGRKLVYEESALNDIVVSSAIRSKIAKLNLSINGTFAACFKSDGLIVATPTGSTAYNLSAGGPILEETLNNMIINTICSFTLSARPLVIDEKSKIEISIPEQAGKIVVYCDGHNGFSLCPGDVVKIEKSKYSSFLVRNNKRNSIEVLRDKLGWAGGFNA